jgi:hypothetical protein
MNVPSFWPMSGDDMSATTIGASGATAHRSASGDDEGPLGVRARRRRRNGVSADVEDQVVALIALGEVPRA